MGRLRWVLSGALALCVVGLAVRRSPIGVLRTAASAAAVVIAALAAVVVGLTARLLMWDQLALWAVTTGAGLGRGVAPAMSDQIRFVLVDGKELTPHEFRVVASVHAVPVLLAVVAATALIVLSLWPAPNSKTTTGVGVGTPDPDTDT